MNPDSPKNHSEGTPIDPMVGKWLSMSEASVLTPYSAEYLSLLARKGKLSAKKINNAWYTTQSILDDYMKKQMIRVQVQNGNFNALETPAKILDKAPDVQIKNVRSFHGDIQEYLEKYQESLPKNKVEIGVKSVPVKRPSPVSGFLNFIPKSLSELTSPVRNIFKSKSSATPEVINIKKTENPQPVLEQMFAPITLEIEGALERVLDKKFSGRSLGQKPAGRIESSFRDVLSSKTLIGVTIVCVLIFSILPVPIVFSFFEKSVGFVKSSLMDANTVLGFRPGTHANEILLLSKDGNISIMGHIETEGQLRSFVKDGTAPIVVDSKTLVKNLNAEYLGGASSTEFTLAFVTKNGNVTTEDVYLRGGVEIGETLLVEGATKLLSTLEVGGGLEVFGAAQFNDTLKVLGPAYFEGIINAKRDVNVQGNLSLAKNAYVKGSVEVGSSLIARSGSFGSLGVTRNFSARGDIDLGSSENTLSINSENITLTEDGSLGVNSVSADSGDFLSLCIAGDCLTDWATSGIDEDDVNDFINASSTIPKTYTANVWLSEQTFSDINFVNATGTSATTTNFFTNTLGALIANITSIVADDVSVGALTATNSTTTSATTTNAFVTSLVSTNATTTNLFSTNATFTNLLASTLDLSNLLVTGSTTLQNFTAINSTTTSATTTNAFIESLVSTTASTTNLFFTTAQGGNITSSGTGTFANILANGSTTLQNFTFINATGTSATTTNLFSTNAIFTNASVNFGTFANILATASTTLQNFTATNSTTTNATSTNFFSNTLNALIARITSIVADDVSVGALTATNSTTTNATSTTSFTSTFGLGNDYITDITGAGLQIVGGALSLDATGDWTGTFDGFEGSYYIANSFATTSADFWLTEQTTDDLDEGITNLYWTNDRFDARLSSTTTLPNLTTLLGLTDIITTRSTTTSATTTNLFSTNGTFTNASVNFGTFANILATASTTLQNFTFINATGTSATTTNLFSTNGTFTNLLAGTLNLTNLIYANATGTNSTTTNLYFSNNLTGPNNFIVNSSGNVGIGTTGPTDPLHVVGDLKFTGNLVAGNGTNFTIRNAADSSNILTLANDGDTASIIGTNTLQFLSNGTVVDLGNGQRAWLIQNTNANGRGAYITAPNVSGANAGIAYFSGTTVRSAAEISRVASGFGNLLLMKSGGNVGIGTSTPWASLSVTNTGTGPSFVVEDDTSPDSTPFLIDASGNVGIGSSTPSTKLSVSGNTYLTGGLGVGRVNTAAGTLETSGVAGIGSSLFLRALLSCDGSASTLRTDGVGQVVCGTVTAIGGTSAGGWTWITPHTVQLATTSDYVLIGSASSSPYAKLALTSGNAATTTLALSASSGQTANILDLYTSDTLLNSVITSTGRFGLGTTAPESLLAVSGGASIGANFNVAAPANGLIVEGNVGIGTNSPNYNLEVNGTASTSDLFVGRSTTTSATTTNFFSNTLSALIANITSIVADDVSVGALTATNSTTTSATTTNLFSTNATFTNASVNLGTFANILATASTTLQNFTFINATGTRATTTNFFSTTGTFTNTSANLGTFANILATASTTLQNFTFINATGTRATTTNFFSTTGTFTNLLASTLNLTNLLVTGSTTLQNFTFINATGTAATTTNFYTSGQTILAGTAGSTQKVGIGTTNPLAKLHVNSFDGTLDQISAIFHGGEAWTNGFNRVQMRSGDAEGVIFTELTNVIGASGNGADFRIRVADASNILQDRFTIQKDGNIGIGLTAPTTFKLEVAGNIGPEADNTRDLGAVARRYANIYATNINSSNLNVSGLTPSRLVATDASSNLTSSITAANLLSSVTGTTGTGNLVFGTSPAITTSLTTGSASFDLLNTNATTINFGGAATALNLGAATGVTNIRNNLLVTGSTTLQNFTFTNATGTSATTTNLFSTTLRGTNAIADTAFLPDINDGAALGTTALAFSDLFLASGGVINFANGNYNLTHTSGNLTSSGQFNTANLLVSASTTLQNFTATNSTTTSATTTNLFSTNATFTNLLASTLNLTNLLVTGSTTLQNFTFINATGTAATTTNFYTSGQTILAGASGNVGIGTSSPAAKLDVNGQVFVRGSLSDTGLSLGNSGTSYSDIGYNITHTGAPNTYSYTGADTASMIRFEDGGFMFRGTQTTGVAGNLITFENLMTILKSGNVGIGTISPNYKLEVNGTASTSNLFVGNSTTTSATTTNFFSTTGTFTNLLASTLNLTNLLVTGSTTLQNFTFINATGTAATTTNFFSTTLRGTNAIADTAFLPDINDGAALGTTALAFSDLFLASGAVINIANDWTATHSANVITIGSGDDIRMTTAGTNSASVVTVGGAQTLTSKTLTSPVINTGTVGTSLIPTANDGATLGNGTNQFSDLFLASGGVINFANGNYNLTHTSGNLTSSGQFNTANLLVSASTTLQNFTATNSTTTSATTTNLFSTTASSTNLFSTNATLGLLTATNSTTTSATTTNFFSTTGTFTNLLASTLNLTNLLVTGSTTLQNFTFINATGTAATTTNFYTSGQTILAGTAGSTQKVGIGTTNPLAKLHVNSFDGTLDQISAIFHGGEAWTNGFNRVQMRSGDAEGVIFTELTNVIGASGNGADFRIRVADASNILQDRFTIQKDGNIGIGLTAPTTFKLEVAGNIGPEADNTRDLGAVARRYANIYATNINSSNLNVSGLTPSRLVATDASSNLTSSITAANLLSSVTGTTGTGNLVFGTSPAITTSLTTGSASFDLLNTNATTINFGGAATALNLGAATGVTNIRNNLLVTGSTTLQNFTFTNATGTSATTTNLFSTTLRGTNAIADTAFLPDINDGAALGTTALAFSDLFLASGGVINFANGNYNLTHTSGNLTSSGQFNTANLLVSASTTLQNFTATNSTTTSATTTNLFSTNASSTNLFSTTGNIGTLTAGPITSGLINGQTISSAANFTGTLTATGGLTTLSNLLLTGSSTLQNFTFTNATGTSATTTNLFSTNATFTNLLASTLNLTNLLVTGSTTLQNFTFINATGTAATTTNFFSTTLRGTNAIADTAFLPDINDGAALGTTALAFSDLFLASGAVINMANDWTATHSANVITIGSGDDIRMTTAGTNASSVVTVGGAQTLTSKTLTSPVINTGTVGTSLIPTANDGATLGNGTNQFSDLFLASGGVINFANGNYNLTHTSGNLTSSGQFNTANLLVSASTTLQNFTFTNATGTSATTTNLFSTTGTFTNLLASTLNLTNLLVTGSTTLQNFTFINATGTSATTTNFFSTTASSTNLFSSLLTVGGNALVVDASRNVGIGTTLPRVKLHINGSPALAAIGTEDQLIFDRPFNSGVASGPRASIKMGMGDATSNPMARLDFALTPTGGALPLNSATMPSVTVMTLLGNSNVGIGTTSPLSRMHVATGNSGVTAVSSNADEFVIEGSAVSGMTILSGATSDGSIFFGDSGSATIGRIVYDHNVNDLSIWTNATERVTVSSTGNFGIGTSSPSERLDVSGNIELGDNATYIKSVTTGGTSVRMLGINASNVAYLGPIDSGAVGSVFNAGASSLFATFYTSGSERMRIDASGNVGIGTTSPTYKLSVEGTSSLGNQAIAGYFTATSTTVDSVLVGFTATRSTTTQATSTNLFSTTGTFTNLFATTGNLSNLLLTGSTTLQNFTFVNATGTSATTTNFFSTTLSALIARVTSIVADDVSVGALTATNSTSTSATSTNLFSTNGTFTNLFAGTINFTNLLVSGSSTLQNFTFINATGTSATTTNLFSTNATFTNLLASTLNLTNLLVTGSTTLQNFTAINSTSTSATTTNFFSTTLSALIARVTSIVADDVSVGALTATNSTSTSATSTNLFSTNGTFTNLFAGTINFTNLLVSGSSTLQNFTAVNSTTTSATTTNFFSTTASSTNLFSTTGNIGTLIAGPITSGLINGQTISSAANFTGTLTVTGGLTTLSNLLLTGSSTLQNFTFTNATGTSATTTNLFSTNATFTNLLASTLNLTNLLVTGSTTLQNFTFVNATGTSATTTNFFSTTASSTNLFSSLLTVGGNALVVDSNRNVGIGTVSPISKLQVDGGSAASILRLTNTSSGATATDGIAMIMDSGGLDTSLWNYESGYLRFGTSNTERVRITSTGNFGIGSSTPGARLTVEGSDTSASTRSFQVTDSNDKSLWEIRNDGQLLAPTSSSTLVWDMTAGTTSKALIRVLNIPNSSGSSGIQRILEASPNSGTSVQTIGLHNFWNGTGVTSLVFSSGPATAPTSFMDIAAIPNHPAGNMANTLSLYPTWNPTTAAGAAAVLSVTPTVNQVGATGITRGLYVNPTLTAAADFRAVDIANNAHYGVYQSGASARNYFNGNVGIGTTTPWAKLSITNTGTGPSFVVEDSASPDSTPFIVDASGNVGIGRSAPNSKLNILHTVSALSGLANPSNYFQTYSHDVNTDGFGIGICFTVTVNVDTNCGGSIVFNRTGPNSQGELQFYTKNSTSDAVSPELRMVIDNSGNLGIGSTTPLYRLSVEGTSSLGNQAIAGYFTATSTTVDSTFQGLTAVRSTTTQATSTNLFSTNATFTNLLASTLNLTNLLVTGSTTLQNFTAINSTSTSATTTNFFSTTASSTNLFFTTAQGGSGSFSGRITAGNASGAGISNSSVIAGTGPYTTAGTLTLFDTRAQAADVGPQLVFRGYRNDGASTARSWAAISGIKENSTTDSDLGALAFFTINASTQTERMRIDSSGNLGIGTTTPWGKLSVTNTGSGPSFVVEDGASPDSTPFIVDASGNVGIGSSTPSEKLAVQGNVKIVGKVNADAVAPTFVGSLVDAVRLEAPEGVAVQGGYAYVTAVGNSDTLAVIDISNPASPAIVGTTTAGTFTAPGDVIVNGKYAYVIDTTLDALKIIDVSNPTSPIQVGSVSSSLSLDGAEEIFLSGKYVYVAGRTDDMITVVDISNPTRPAVVSSIAPGINDLNDPWDVIVKDNYAYVSSRLGADGLTASAHISIFDVSNPADMKLVATTTSIAEMNDSRGLAISGRYLYVTNLTGDSLVIYDISNPAIPVLVSATTTTNLDGAVYVEARGRYVYISGNASLDGIAVYDVSVPATPVFVGKYTDSAGSGSLDGSMRFAMAGRYLYGVSQIDDTFTVLEIGSELPTLSIGDLAVHNFYVQSSAQISSDLQIGGGLNIIGSLTGLNGITSFLSSSSTLASTNIGFRSSVLHNGIVTTGTDNNYGVFASSSRSGATGGTINNYGGYFHAESDNAGSGTANNYGIYSIVSGGDNNYSGVFMGGGVGIGTALPIADLHISSSTGVSMLIQSTGVTTGDTANLFFKTSSNTSDQVKKGAIIFERSASGDARGSLHFALNNSSGSQNASISDARLTILEGGNVGIGTTTPSQKFEVYGGTDPRIRIDTNTGQVPGFELSVASARKWLIYNDTSDKLIFRGGSNDRLTIDTSGNVGVGTTTPGTKLDIYDASQSTVEEMFRLSGTLAAVNSGKSIDFYHTNANAYARIAGVTNSVGGTGEIAFYTNTNLGTSASAEKVRITGAGNFGIGSTSPTYQLSVEGTSSLGNQAIAGYFTATSTTVNSSFQGLTALRSTTTQATSTNLFSTNGTFTNLFAGTINFTNLLVSGSSTLQNFTFVNATGTSATTTNIFSTTGTFTNLCITGDSCITAWPTAAAANSKWATSTGSIITPNGGGGILVVASSTIGAGTQAGGLTISGGATTTGNLLVSGNATSTNFFSTTLRGTNAIADTAFLPDTNDGATLGTTALAFSDLFLASGAVINIANDWTATHSANVLTIGSGDDIRMTTAGTNSASVVTVGGAQTLTSKTLTSPVINTGTIGTSLVPTANDGATLGNGTNQFSDLFLASGGVINFANGNYNLTHTSGNLTSSGQFNTANLLVSASTTLQNFTAVNSTTTQATSTNFAISSLTSGRVPFVSTGGALVDSSALTFNSSVGRLTTTYASTTALSSSGSAYFATTEGAVGIGETNPLSILDVKMAANNHIGFRVGNLNSTYAQLTAYTDTAATNVGMEFKASEFHWNIGNTDRMTIDQNGLVGIGTSTPSTKFSVGGAAGDTTGHGYFTGGVGIGAVNTSAGTLTTTNGVTIGGVITASNLTASRLVATDASKNLVSTITLANLVSSISDVSGSTGTTNLVLSVSPTLTGTPVLPATFTMGANSFIRSGAHNLTLTTSAATNVTLPTSGTLYGTASGSITSAQLITSVSNETGSGVLVFGTSPAITTSLTTASASFDLLNANATTINFGGAATALNLGASTGTTTLAGSLVVDTNSLVVDRTTDRVGIGTVTPGAKLEVNGDIKVQTGSATAVVPALFSNHQGISLTSDPNSESVLVYGYNYGSSPIFRVAAKTFTSDVRAAWDPTASTILIALASGEVGVGSTTPWGLLSVNANGLTAGKPQFVVGSSTATHFIVANGGNVGIGMTNPGAYKLNVNGNTNITGDLTVSGTISGTVSFATTAGGLSSMAISQFTNDSGYLTTLSGNISSFTNDSGYITDGNTNWDNSYGFYASGDSPSFTDLDLSGTLTGVDAIFSGDVTANCFFGGGFQPTFCSDLAENYYASENLEPGDVIEISSTQVTLPDGTKAFAIRKNTSSNQIMGVVSTSPGLLLEGGKVIMGGGISLNTYVYGEKAPVVLAGRIPVKVTDENGVVQKGDFLTTSVSMPGYAMKATSSSKVLGQALVDFNDASTTVQKINGVDVRVGKVMTFANVSWEDIDGNTFASTTTASLSELGQAMQNNSLRIDSIEADLASLMNQASTTLAVLETNDQRISVLENLLASSTVFAQSTTTIATSSPFMVSVLDSIMQVFATATTYFKDVVVMALTIGQAEKPTGITFYDTLTGDPYCLKVTGGVQVTTPGVCVAESISSTPTEEIVPATFSFGGEGGGETSSTTDTIIENTEEVIEETPVEEIVDEEAEGADEGSVVVEETPSETPTETTSDSTSEPIADSTLVSEGETI